MTATTSPRIYVACLASYNNGVLHGAWIDATLSEDEIQQEINKMLKSSPVSDAEEWAIHDYEGFNGLSLGSCNLEKISEIAQAIEQHGEIYAKYADYVGIEYADPDEFQECYKGEFESMADFAENRYEETGEINDVPAWAKDHIDWESIAHDWKCSGDYWTIETGYEQVHVFQSK